MHIDVVLLARFLLFVIALLLGFLAFIAWNRRKDAARNLIFDSIRDAVLIFDSQERLIDFNPAAEGLFPELKRSRLGGKGAQIFSGRPDLLAALGSKRSPADFTLERQSGIFHYEIGACPLLSGTRRVGQAAIFSDVTAQVLLQEDLRRRAETDALTGVANRRRFHQALEIECLRFSRSHSPLSVLMIDLDNFKDVNDRYGHPAGDSVLQSVAQMLLTSLRKTDLLARFGGEEFAVLLPDTRGDGAQAIAERLRQSVCSRPIQVDGTALRMSVSVGVASHSNDREVDPQILMKKADLALYRAKATGRNRVEMV